MRRRASLPELSFVVVNWNTAWHLQRCLAALPAAAGGRSYEVIVVDNGSTDDSTQVAAEVPLPCRLIALPSNRGFPVAANIGLAEALGSWLCLLNADVTLYPGSAGELSRYLEEHPWVGVVSCGQVDESGRRIASYYSDPTLLAELQRNLLFRDSILSRLGRGPWKARTIAPKEVDWVMGSLVLLRRQAWEAAGPFDEGVFMYGEDWDLCFRLRRWGWRIAYLPREGAVHAHNVSGEQAFGEERYGRVLASSFYFQRKHYGRTYTAAVALVCGLGAGLRLLLLLPALGTNGGRRRALRYWYALGVAFGRSGLLQGVLSR